MFLATLAIGAIVVNGGYEYAIILPRSDRDALVLTALSILIAVGSCLLFLLLSILFGSYLWGALNTSELITWQEAMVGSILIEGLNQPLRLYLNR